MKYKENKTFRQNQFIFTSQSHNFMDFCMSFLVFKVQLGKKKLLKKNTQNA